MRLGMVERGRLRLPLPTDQWLNAALAYPGVRLLDLTPDATHRRIARHASWHSLQAAMQLDLDVGERKRLTGTLLSPEVGRPTV